MDYQGREHADTIATYNAALDEYIRMQVAEKNTVYQNHTPVDYAQYTLIALFKQIQEHVCVFAAQQGETLTPNDIIVESIDRAQFCADITVRITALIKQLGKGYTTVFLPALQDYLLHHIADIAQIEQKGIYVNITLAPDFFSHILTQVEHMGEAYARSDVHHGDIMLAEYSSPNAAKHLHAGHIRSTVIGQLLANIYARTGYNVHRVNHINDRGGFGELIVGYDRWAALLTDAGYQGNDLSFMLYTIYRTAEKIVAGLQHADTPLSRDEISEEQKQMMHTYFAADDAAGLIEAFAMYKYEAKETFHRLEQGGSNEFAIWEKILGWSLQEFNTFYHALHVHHDFVIGESFYEKRGKQIVTEGIDQGIIVHFTQERADAYWQDYLAHHADEKETLQEKKREEVMNDVGSYVALLDDYERFVVLRSDGASIYATRDLGCLAYRCTVRNPSVVMYEVGQEQADHFAKLFETAKKFTWHHMADGRERTFLHVYHGFYVNAETKKKLSSRDGASNVQALFAQATAHFLTKYDTTTTFTKEQAASTAEVLGRASVIINDVRKSRTASVYLDADIQKAVAGFEESGGPYLMYTLCRALSLIKKAAQDDTDLGNSIVHTSTDNKKTTQQENEDTLDDTMIDIVKKIADAPQILRKAADEHEPSLVVDYMYQLAQQFNTLYSAKKQITKSSAAMAITRSYAIVMKNLFAVLNIDALERM